MVELRHGVSAKEPRVDAEGPRSRDALSPRGPGGCGTPAASLLSDIKGGDTMTDWERANLRLRPTADGWRPVGLSCLILGCGD